MFRDEQTFVNLARTLTPTFLGVFGVIALSLPIRLFEGTIPTPLIPLIVIYFWSIYGSEYVPPISTFAIGLAQDMILGGPFGVWASAYLIAQYLIVSQRDYFLGREQHVVWLGFLIAAGTAGTIVWAAMCLVAKTWLPVMPMISQILITFAFYPVFAVVFSGLHERVITVN